MIDAQKPDHVSLSTLVNRLRDGRFVIPDFQRDFEWQPWDISALMRSIFLDYYIGSLLLWKGKQETFEALACENIYGFGNNRNSPEHIVLDGQQRLTAMYYAFMAPDISAPKRNNRYRYFISVDKFQDGAYDDAFFYDWTRRSEQIVSDRQKQFETHVFPLAVIGQTGWAMPNWVQDYEKYWLSKVDKANEAGDNNALGKALKHAQDARDFGEHLRGITEQYQISYIELDRDLELDKVCDIFTQINSRGVRLDVFDLFNALLRPKGVQLRHMWREAEERLAFVNTDRMNVYVLQVMSILRQGYCSPKYLYYLLPGQERQLREPDGSLRREVLVPDIKNFVDRWNEAIEALAKAINLLRHPQEFGVISSRYLPYVAILPGFAAIQTEARNLPAHRRLDAQRKIRHWYWSSIFLNRYSGSVESTTARDYQDLRAWFDDDSAEPAMIEEFRERFRNLDLRSETRRGTSAYSGIFNLLVLGGARDWISGNVPQYDDLDDHHIVPQSWGKEQRVGTAIDSILNRTPLSGDTNRNIVADRLPNSYLPDLIKTNGETEIRRIFESHFISPAAFDILLRDPFMPDDFEDFLMERKRTILNAIEDLLIKDRLDLEPRLRELDAEIEAVELNLRNCIAGALSDNQDGVPSHVRQKINERLNSAIRKNPAIDRSEFDSIAKLLQFADLRELQDIIVSKQMWPEFASRFGSTGNVSIRFDQLADLRNKIRHSRAVDDIARSDGKASLLWFAAVLRDCKPEVDSH